MIKINEELKIVDNIIYDKLGENKENLDDIKYLFIYIDFLSKSNPTLNNKILFNLKSLSLSLNYTEQLISAYLVEIKNNINKKKLIYKKIIRNIKYLIKQIKSKYLRFKKKIYCKEIYNMIIKFFFTLNYNLLKYVIQAKSNIIPVKDKDLCIFHLNILLNEMINLITLFYKVKIINDDILEEILKLLLIFSLVKNIEKAPKKADEIINMIFFKGCIDLVKSIFNTLYISENTYTQRQEELINNIILFINENIICPKEQIEINYLNKFFLSSYDYKTSLLIDLSNIILKIKSKDIQNNYMNLLTDIYSFSFKYENGIRPTLLLLESCFTNIQKKQINIIKKELNKSDFILSFISSLINKENEIIKNNSCMLKQGFYFGNKYSGIVCDLGSLDNEFIIMFGFRIESEPFDNILLFDIKNIKTDSTQIKFYLEKTLNDNYQLLAYDNKMEKSTKININEKKNYIISFHFKINGLKQSYIVKINYIKDEDNDSKEAIHSGKEIIIKNFKNDNLSLYFGCEMNNNNKGKTENKFRGFLGDIILLNVKNIKEKNDFDFDKDLLLLKRNYYKIFSLFTENLENFLFPMKINNNPKFLELKEKINEYNENECKLFKTIKMIISPQYFRFIKFNDDIDYMNSNNNYENKLLKKDSIFQIKKNYINFIINNDDLDGDKKIIINTSIFDKYFHIFDNEFTLNEFIKGDGIHYLCLLLEYYFQVLSLLCETKYQYDINDIKNICKEINQKILNVLNFFFTHIILTKIYLNFWEEVNQFFYQMSIALLKLIEIEIINCQIIKYLVNLLNNIDGSIRDYINHNKNPKLHLSLRKNLFEFLLNQKLYQGTNESRFENIYVVIKNLTIILVLNSEKNKIKYLKDIFQIEIFKKLLSFIFLLDNEINNDKHSDLNNNNLILLAEQNYMVLLVEYLILSFQKINDNNNKSSQKLIKIKEQMNYRSCSNLLKIKYNDKKNCLNCFLEKMKKQYRNKLIFSNMAIILIETKLINELEDSNINEIKLIIIKELKECNKINSLDKKYIYLSCLRILIEYHFSKCNDNDAIDNIKYENDFHKFIRSLDIDLEFFHCLIFSIKYIYNLLNENDFEIIEKENIIDEKVINLEKNIKHFEKYFNFNFSDLSLSGIDICKLSELQAHIIKTIFEDIIYLLYKIEKKKLSKQKERKAIWLLNSDNNNQKDIGKEIYEIMKKNIDDIFKYPESKLYNLIFSSKSEICAELFYYKWKIEGDIEYKCIENDLKKYHKELLGNHKNSFIFKFLFFISDESVLPFETELSKDINDNKEKIIKFRIDMMIFIIESLNNYHIELKNKKESMLIYVNNLLNFIILLNEEINYKRNELFENNAFCKSLYKFIIIIKNSGLLYTKFYIELNEKYGKTICESIYDLFFSLSIKKFNKEIFTEIFIKINQKEKEVFTTFYLIDLLNEKCLEKDKKLSEELDKLIPELKNKRYLEENYISNTNKKKAIKLFLKKNMYYLENINFSIYFLAKTFIYFNSSIMENDNNKNLKEFLLNKFIPILSKDIFRLYTKRNIFYGNKKCRKFPLYNLTKKYIESVATQKPIDIYKLISFFQNEMKDNLKKEYSIFFCYSSRLLHDIQKSININSIKEKTNNSISYNVNSQFSLNKTFHINIYKLNEVSLGKKIQFLPTKSIYNSNIKDLLLNNVEGNNFFNIIKVFKKDEPKEFISSFGTLIKNNIIKSPKKLFFKIVFSEIFKNIIFNDKAFKLIKIIYLIYNRKFENLCKESKQMNYPVKQKNYSNFLEPKIFLKRDFNFYENEFFPISHQYIRKEFLEEKIENLFLYKHICKFKNKELKKFLYCELVTEQYIYFGKMYFLENLIFFSTEKDPRNNVNDENDLEIFMKYSISTRNSDNMTSKKKLIIIFNDDIKEVIQRRTLLVNQSIEIFCKNGKSYFFNFFRTKEIEKVYIYFNEINKNFKFIFSDNNNEDDIKMISSSFRNGKKSNYDYLLYLNKYSTRTYNDLSQYPIFPWLSMKKDKYEEIFISLEKNDIPNLYLRDLNYAISLQTKEKRNEVITKFKREERDNKFPFHLYKHYSTPGYIYYYLIRMNPYTQIMIKFQNCKLEDSNRIFNSFNEIEEILNGDSDNRELIPDMFCYFDFFCNLNCTYFNERFKGDINDDFNNESNISPKYINNIAGYAYFLYNERKLLNSYHITREIYKWVDLIFGKKQIPIKKEDAEECCNIYNKLTYSENINLEEKFKKYRKLINENKIKKKIFFDKMKNKIELIANFGMTPKKILKESNIYVGENISINDFNKIYHVKEGKLIFFKKLQNDSFVILKDEKRKNNFKRRIAVVYKNKNFKTKDNATFDFSSFNLLPKNMFLKENYGNVNIPLYHPDYSISFLYFHNNILNKSFPILLSCRYYGNFFKLHSHNKSLNIQCEDFVTCIKGRNLFPKEDDYYFYIGLLNGKLIEWKIKSYLSIKETKHVHSHKNSITAIEIYSRQNIIITSGEDKFIYIRKVFDFELLTVIDLTHSFENPIISQTSNVFPSLIKISELNLLYVLLYNYDTKNSIIRGYNLNGLFFAQTDDKYFKDYNNNNLIINNISFTKSYNLVIGFYNSNKYSILVAWGLIPICQLFDIIIDEENEDNFGTELVEYDYNFGGFYILYKNKFVILSHKNKDEQKNFN